MSWMCRTQKTTAGMHSQIARKRLQIGNGENESKIGLKAMLESTIMSVKTYTCLYSSGT